MQLITHCRSEPSWRAAELCRKAAPSSGTGGNCFDVVHIFRCWTPYKCVSEILQKFWCWMGEEGIAIKLKTPPQRSCWLLWGHVRSPLLSPWWASRLPRWPVRSFSLFLCFDIVFLCMSSSSLIQNYELTVSIPVVLTALSASGHVRMTPRPIPWQRNFNFPF